jgi:hypothetical protein
MSPKVTKWDCNQDMGILLEQDEGPRIVSTNYWESEMARQGVILATPRQGVLRLLLPCTHWGDLSDMRAAEYCVLSRGPWPAQHLSDAVEIMFEDGSNTPFVILLSPDSFWGKVPQADEREWRVAIWTQKDGNGIFT